MFSKSRDPAASSVPNPFYNAGYMDDESIHPGSLPNFDISITVLHLLGVIVPVLLPIACGSSGTAHHSILLHPVGFNSVHEEGNSPKSAQTGSMPRT